MIYFKISKFCMSNWGILLKKRHTFLVRII